MVGPNRSAVNLTTQPRAAREPWRTISPVNETPMRRLPSVDAVLRALGDGSVGARPVTVAAAREVLADLRAAIRRGTEPPPLAGIVDRVRERAAASARPSLRPVINATGVILQTNLGRAPLADRAIRAIEDVAPGYTNLEFDLEAGARGSRHGHLRDLIRTTTGAEDGIAVNNNAAALFMALQVFAAGREVIISRGHAVEIGGGVRIPDVMRQSGARLVEVGTTNRTYARDYAAAIGPETAAILRVHPSNFRVIGFTAEASIRELAALARERNVLLLDDLGSGCLVDTRRWGLAPEPTVQESVAAGAGLALFSGDKLLGGPQAGIIAGKAEHVATLRAHPLARVLRVDKLTIAALTATLQAYVEGREALDIPVWRMLSADLRGLRRRARRWAAVACEAGTIVRSKSMVGGGSLPGEGVDTWCAAIRPPGGADALAAAMRAGSPPVVARIEDGAVLLDPRTVPPAADQAVAGALVRALAPPVQHP